MKTSRLNGRRQSRLNGRRQAKQRHPRQGFTLIELLVVIAIIATLASLILPGIQSAREAARRIQCVNRLRNISVALHNHAGFHGDQFTEYGGFTQILPAGNANPTPHEVQCAPGGLNWVVNVLPFLDQAALFERFDFTPTTPEDGAANRVLGAVPLDILVCPDDFTATDVPGGLSYVINSGYANMTILDEYASATGADNNPTEMQMHTHNLLSFDWDGDGDAPGVPPDFVDSEDAAITRGTGIAWIRLGAKNFSLRVSEIRDGMDQTILLGENLNAGHLGSWAKPSVPNCAFVYPIEGEAAGPPTFKSPIVPVGVDPLPNGALNDGAGIPFLSSLHPGIVNVAMAGGSVQSLSANLNAQVYKDLITPGGVRFRPIPGFANEDILSSSDF